MKSLLILMAIFMMVMANPRSEDSEQELSFLEADFKLLIYKNSKGTCEGPAKRCKEYVRPGYALIRDSICTPRFQFSIVDGQGSLISSANIMTKRELNSINFDDWADEARMNLTFSVATKSIASGLDLVLSVDLHDMGLNYPISATKIPIAKFGFSSRKNTEMINATDGLYFVWEQRFVCAQNYYSKYCNVSCVETDRLICDDNGNPSCIDGYLLPDCNERDPCFQQTCSNNGNCIANKESAEGFECQCVEHFMGDRCQYSNIFSALFDRFYSLFHKAPTAITGTEKN